MSTKKLIIYTDGGARGNPGPAGIGAVIYDENNNLVREISEYIGETTNNQAEYRAVIAALEKACDLNAKELIFYLDSELVVKQLNGEYRVKNKDLAPLFVRIHNLKLNFSKVQFFHIPREKNKEADKLVNKAINLAISQRGGTMLLITVLILASILVVILGLNDIVRNNLQFVKMQNDSTRAYFAAETGAERILWEIRENGFNIQSCSIGDYICFDSSGSVIGCASDCSPNTDTQVLSNNAQYKLQYDNNGDVVVRSFGTYKDESRVVEISY